MKAESFPQLANPGNLNKRTEEGHLIAIISDDHSCAGTWCQDMVSGHGVRTWCQAPQVAEALDALQRAAEQARRSHDRSAEAQYLRQQLERADGWPAEQRARRVQEVTELPGDALHAAGEDSESLRILRSLDGVLTADVDRARLLRKRGVALIHTESPGRGIEAFRASLALVGPASHPIRWRRIVQNAASIAGLWFGGLFRRPVTPQLRERALAHR